MRFAVLIFLCLVAVISYVQRTGINSVKKPICDDVGIDTEEFGMLGSAWLVGYAIMQVPGGWLADRFGGRIVLAALAILWSILTGLLGWCSSFEIMLALWFGMGLAATRISGQSALAGPGCVCVYNSQAPCNILGCCVVSSYGKAIGDHRCAGVARHPQLSIPHQPR